ncbi:transcriptional regulator, partial [Natronoarchaeum mannanilyticum]
MNTRTQERVERWESRSFSGGYGGLRDLSDSDFSGAVEAAGAWLFMLNGRVVGIHEGSIEDFEDASGTAHVAPDPALPLLFSMWETGGETQGKYYTEDTSVSEVDDTLTSGSFTGYLELSENVLSGDYYVVYYGGRSMSAAFVGNKEELLGGDEAFERADDEVGIYEVIDVDVDVIEIPEPEGADTTDESATSDDAAVAGGPAPAPD